MSKTEKIIPVKKGDQIELTVEDLASSGDGICRLKGYTLFTPGYITGDKILVEVINTTPRFGVCRILKMISPSPIRIEPACQVFHRCGGCQLQYLPYSKQREFKLKIVKDAIERIGKLECPEEMKFSAASPPLNYRNKGMFPVRQEAKRVKIGYYSRRSHNLVNVRECPVLVKPIDQIKEQIREIVNRRKPGIYDEDSQSGLIRHIIVRGSITEGEFLVGFVTTSGHLNEKIIHDVKNINISSSNRHKIVGIVQNINTRKTNAILGKENRVLWGRGFYYEKIGKVRYSVSLPSFFQANKIQTEKLNGIVKELLSDEKGPILDAYCGAGSIALWIADQGRDVIGVEEQNAAVRDAMKNAEDNKIKNCHFVTDKVEVYLKKNRGLKFSNIILDPPRKGCSEEVTDSILKLKPGRIIYVSCNPSTLARDLNKLCERYYEMTDINVIDMFPQTAHVETIVALNKKSS